MSVKPEVLDVLTAWPDESREAAQLVVDTYGTPHEVTPTELRWFGVGPWKRIVASRSFWSHEFPAPHIDCVESSINYHVPPATAGAIAEFDGSVIIDRTAGEVSARCHDEQANMLALNLVHDIVSGERDAASARAYYVQEFLDARRHRPTPYMSGLRFVTAAHNAQTIDPDQRVLSDAELHRAQAEGDDRGGA